MYFFKEFPKEKFNYNGRYTQELIDVTTRIKLLDYVKNHKDLSQVGIRSNYEIFPGQRPEEISFELYESYDYVWTILILNNIYSIFEDWIQPQEVIEKKLIKEYGSIEKANQTPAAYYSEFGYEIGESSVLYVSDQFKKREKNYVLLEQQKVINDSQVENNVDDTWMKKLIETKGKRIKSKTETGRVVENNGSKTETVYERVMRENEEKKFIRVFEPRVIFRVYSEFSGMIEK